MNDLKLIEVDIDSIKPYRNNPRYNDEAVWDVMQSIEDCTYLSPIIVDENMVILAGHTRHDALKKLGAQTVKVVVKDGLTSEQKKKFRIIDNKVGEASLWDKILLSDEIEPLDFSKYMFEWGNLEKQEKKEKKKQKPHVCPGCGYAFFK